MTSQTSTAWMEESLRQSKRARRVQKERMKVVPAEVAQAIAIVVVAAAAAVVVVQVADRAAVREVTVVAIPAVAVDAADGRASTSIQYSVMRRATAMWPFSNWEAFGFARPSLDSASGARDVCTGSCSRSCLTEMLLRVTIGECTRSSPRNRLRKRF